MVLHDYGYGMKVGNAYYSGDDVDPLEMSKEVLDKTGAEVVFIRDNNFEKNDCCEA